MSVPLHCVEKDGSQICDVQAGDTYEMEKEYTHPAGEQPVV